MILFYNKLIFLKQNKVVLESLDDDLGEVETLFVLFANFYHRIYLDKKLLLTYVFVMTSLKILNYEY